MPIISTTHCDIPNILSPANVKHLAPERHVAALANNMWQLIKNPQLAHELAIANRQFIEEHLNVSNCSRNLLLNYKALI
jgi:colanic acid/amylovoran biosynthesis glycosyltransferase